MSANYKVVFRNRANIDFIDAYTWYEKQQEGLGERFFNAIVNKSELISSDPHLFKTSYNKYHEVLLDKFPYLIIYTINDRQKIVRIMAIFHTSRNPHNKYKKQQPK